MLCFWLYFSPGGGRSKVDEIRGGGCILHFTSRLMTILQCAQAVVLAQVKNVDGGGILHLQNK